MTNARPVRRPATGRALGVLAAVLATAAAALVALALWPSGIGDTSDMSAAPATVAETPTTIPPETGATPTDDPTPTDDATQSDGATRADGATQADGDPAADASAAPSTAPTTTIELSPLAELLGSAGSAIPPAIEPRVRPASLTIDDLDLRAPVRAVGLDDGELEVPDETEIGWYQYGATPGRPGATVLAAHVTWNQTTGPFFRLRDLEPGARVDVALEDGTSRTYEVIERAIYDKDSLPRDRIWRNTGDEQLVLITCGGSFNPDINRYRQNVVVYAVPVDASDDVRRATS